MNNINIINDIEDELFDMKLTLLDFPCLLEDNTVKSLFESLMSVQSVSELDKWMANLEKTELSAFVKSTDPKAGLVNDCFGGLHTLLMAMDEKRLEDVVFLIKKLNSNAIKKLEMFLTNS